MLTEKNMLPESAAERTETVVLSGYTEAMFMQKAVNSVPGSAAAKAVPEDTPISMAVR